MFIFFVTNIFTGQKAIKPFFARQFFFEFFKTTHIFIKVKFFCLHLKHLKLFLPKFLTKLSGEVHKNLKLSIKLNLLQMVKLVHFSNPFGMTFILRLNLPSSYIIRWES